MPLPTTYLITTRNVEPLFNAILGAQAPERFSQKFLADLEFTSSNDRLFIGLLKALGFIDDSGTPQQRYFDFLDQTRSRGVLAEAIREAYDDLFRVNKEAYKLSEDEVKNKLKTLTRGEKSDLVLGLMAKTFKALCDYASWEETPKAPAEPTEAIVEEPNIKPPSERPKQPNIPRGERPSLHYNIQIHLPPTRDSAVYDAIFKSLRDHLL
jgi:hypothetical protein